MRGEAYKVTMCNLSIVSGALHHVIATHFSHRTPSTCPYIQGPFPVKVSNAGWISGYANNFSQYNMVLYTTHTAPAEVKCEKKEVYPQHAFSPHNGKRQPNHTTIMENRLMKTFVIH